MCPYHGPQTLDLLLRSSNPTKPQRESQSGVLRSMAASPPLPTSIDGGQVLDDMEVVEMKYLFGKVLMPSDVSWDTEQLVIPDEHVGKLLDMVVMNRPEGGFFVVVVEDGEVTGKLWLFRYWKRDDVHCLTKGWGCYAREKGLRAGDTVSFHSTACGRFFICCRCTCMSFLSLPTTSHRIHGSSVLPQPRAAQAAHHPFSGHATLCLGNKASDHSAPARHATASLGCAAAQPPQVPPTPTPRRRRRSMMVHPEPPEHTTDGMPVILESMALVSTPPVAKRVRLFGVYIDVPPLRPGGEATQDFNP